mmetsp:Transcript_62044/g.69463  ORF Transcript_62044/g.69463 Transcript_62044/m.69463 type:complete len:104 (-) Transcript_62044:575-886(-)
MLARTRIVPSSNHEATSSTVFPFSVVMKTKMTMNHTTENENKYEHHKIDNRVDLSSKKHGQDPSSYCSEDDSEEVAVIIEMSSASSSSSSSYMLPLPACLLRQ